MDTRIRKWIEKGCPEFFRGIGIREGQTLLDFGCGEGFYTIPASKVVGKNGKVYALDKDNAALDKLKRKIGQGNVKNVELINEGTKIPLKDNSVDVVLFYDVIHLVGKNNRSTVKDRMKFYKAIRRVTNENALVSVYPTHLTTHTDVTSKQEVRKEIEKAGFKFEREVHSELVHDNSMVRGCVLNFRRI
ncbi:MAG: class I SAM-dependent methyltransferase [Candidatus Omnitrophota bacterium]|nr:class I SAM-dependent methyltransferase [Candidatus Omnitrophota bacterium]